MKTIGRWLQITGLVVLPLALILELAGQLGRSAGISQMVWMLVFGVSAFYLGRILEGYAR